MSKSDNKTLEKLRDFADEIDNLNLKDPTAWTNAANELLVVSANLPDGDIAVRDMLEAVHQGLNLMAKQVVTDPLTFIDSLADALMAVEKCIGNESDCENLIQDSKHALERILDNIDLADEENPVRDSAKNEAALLLSLDDAAAFLIQLEPDDAAGITVLKDTFWGMSANLEYPEVCRKMLLDAAELLQPNQDGSHSIDISAVGQILEDAMMANEDPESFRNASINSETSSNNSGLNGNEALPGSRHDYMPMNPDLDLLGEFISESTELIATAEEALLALEADPDDMDAVGKVFRAFHTVKGTSAFLELSLISELGHHAETFLSRVRDKEIRYSGGYADLSFRALDMIKDLIVTVQEILAGAGRPLLKPDGYEELKQFLANPVAVGISDEIDETAASVADNGQAVHTQKRMQRGLIAVESSVRVGTQRLDRLVDMVGELVIAHSMVAQELLHCGSQNLELGKKVAHTSKIVRELQDIGLSMRMVPLKATFNKMARLVRDVSRKLGKNVNFIVEGEDTEIDRNLVDIISDPLVHMIRNAVDHGIEVPDTRSKNHKPETGTVKLAAYHSAGCVVVEIEDDGKGLDRGDILCQARQKGFLSDTPESGDGNLTDREVFNLLFEPGFSTADTVTDVSGRGVGMDVVKNNIESLRGQVEIKSEFGKGSVFKMSLPLTLAIIDGMVIRVGHEMYVIPTVSIIRSVKPAEGAISTVLKQGEVLSFHGNLIPVYRLGELYRIADANQDINDGIIVVVADENRQAGLVIDELVGRHQVVIKSLGETMKTIPGISGGAIMPDGRVGLILDVSDLIRFANIDDSDCGRVEKKFGRKQSLAA